MSFAKVRDVIQSLGYYYSGSQNAVWAFFFWLSVKKGGEKIARFARRFKKSEKIPQILASWTLATGLRIRAGGGMCYAERKPVCVRP